MTLDQLVDELADRLAVKVADHVVARLQGNGAALTPTAAADRLLSAREVASRLGCSVRYVYARAATFPFTKRDGHLVRFSAAGLDRWLANR
jgi:excisionase family DNA binding protein